MSHLTNINNLRNNVHDLFTKDIHNIYSLLSFFCKMPNCIKPVKKLYQGYNPQIYKQSTVVRI